jgi:hypothetical protein
MGSDQAEQVVAKMKETPTDDSLFGKGYIRADGRKMHNMYLFEVKAPADSKAGNTQVSQALHPVEILAEAERGDFDRSRIAAGLLRHIAKFRQDLGDIAAGRRDPAIAIA